MYNHILVPLDESDIAEAALVHAEGLAKCTQARLTLISVLPLDPDTVSSSEATRALARRRKELRDYLRTRCARLEEEGLSCHPSVREGDVGEELAKYAEGHDCDLILMATHGRRGLARWIHGSVVERVLTQTKTPVLIVHAE
jgi:nucleotide-binding universal stress UspA family protein